MHTSPRGLELLAGITSLSGPVCAMLYEAGSLRLLPGDLIYEVWLLVIIASLAAGIGLICFFRGARLLGAACFLSNLVVGLLYGFIALFFAFGGSR